MTKPNDEQQLLACKCGRTSHVVNHSNDATYYIACKCGRFLQDVIKLRLIHDWNTRHPSPRAGLSVTKALIFNVITNEVGTKLKFSERHYLANAIKDAINAQPSDRTVGELVECLKRCLIKLKWHEEGSIGDHSVESEINEAQSLISKHTTGKG